MISVSFGKILLYECESNWNIRAARRESHVWQLDWQNWQFFGVRVFRATILLYSLYEVMNQTIRQVRDIHSKYQHIYMRNALRAENCQVTPRTTTLCLGLISAVEPSASTWSSTTRVRCFSLCLSVGLHGFAWRFACFLLAVCVGGNSTAMKHFFRNGTWKMDTKSTGPQPQKSEEMVSQSPVHVAQLYFWLMDGLIFCLGGWCVLLPNHFGFRGKPIFPISAAVFRHPPQILTGIFLKRELQPPVRVCFARKNTRHPTRQEPPQEDRHPLHAHRRPDPPLHPRHPRRPVVISCQRSVQFAILQQHSCIEMNFAMILWFGQVRGSCRSGVQAQGYFFVLKFSISFEIEIQFLHAKVLIDFACKFWNLIFFIIWFHTIKALIFFIDFYVN